jgi:acyl-CoA hydrolase
LQQPKTVADSAVVMTSLMLPGDANPQGQVHGGTIMKLVDTAAAVAAHRHTRGLVVTARIDDMSFRASVQVGDLVTLRASVNAAWQTSMEVGVRVETENIFTGEIHHTASAYLVLVAVDEDRRPRPVPQLVAQTPEEHRRMAQAQDRRARRIAVHRTDTPPAST